MRVALILVGLGTLAVMQLETPPRTTKRVNEPPAQATVELRASHDTLTTADRLEIPHMQSGTPQPVSSNEPMPPPHQASDCCARAFENHRATQAQRKRRKIRSHAAQTSASA